MIATAEPVWWPNPEHAAARRRYEDACAQCENLFRTYDRTPEWRAACAEARRLRDDLVRIPELVRHVPFAGFDPACPWN